VAAAETDDGEEKQRLVKQVISSRRGGRKPTDYQAFREKTLSTIADLEQQVVVAR